MKTQTANQLSNEAFAHINTLKASKMDFKVNSSNYSVTIEKGAKKWKYLRELRAGKFFAMAKVLEKQVRSSKNYLNIFTHEFTERKPDYYQNKYALLPCKLEKAVCVDINSAYPSTLKAVELIDEKLFNYLQKQPKIDRLAAVGFLASTKNIDHYKQGRLIHSEIKENINKPIFRFCVNYIDILLSSIIEVCPDKFIYYWVDGIYFTEKPNNSEMEEIKYLIEEAGLSFKTEYLKNFSINAYNGNIEIKYLKGNKEKNFLFPDRHLYDLINSYNKKKFSKLHKN